MPSKRIVDGKWNGKWVARVQVGGKSFYNGVSHDTKTLARKAEDALRAELRAPKRNVQTVDGFAGRWVDDYPRPANSTNTTNRSCARQVAEGFKGVRLDQVERVEARRWARTVPIQVVRVACAMFNDAINDGLIPAPNPFSSLRLEQSRGRRDIEVVTDDQLQDLARIAREQHGSYGDEFAAYLLYAAFSCQRPGEINAIGWDDMDFKAGEADVSKSIEASGAVKWPKNGKPRRIVLPPPALEALRMVPRRVDPVTLTDLRHGGEQREFNLVFRAKHGGKLTKPKLADYWKVVRAAFRAEHPESRLKDLYELRHKGATMLLERGLQASDVAVQMGHSDGGRLVQMVYGHPSDEAARDRLRRAWQQPVRLAEVRDDKEQTG